MRKWWGGSVLVGLDRTSGVAIALRIQIEEDIGVGLGNSRI